MHDAQGVSILSKAFNSERLSYCLKIDICAKTKNFSVWIVERGETKDKSLTQQEAFRFNSQVSIAKSKLSMLRSRTRNWFYFLQLRSELSHRALVYHKLIPSCRSQSDEGQSCYQRVNLTLSSRPPLSKQLPTNIHRRMLARKKALKLLSPIALDESGSSLFHLPDQALYWMLSSEQLTVEDKYQVLQFLFQYTKLKMVHKGLSAAIMSVNLLAIFLRIKIYKIMSVIRKNESLQLSEAFCNVTILK